MAEPGIRGGLRGAAADAPGHAPVRRLRRVSPGRCSSRSARGLGLDDPAAQAADLVAGIPAAGRRPVDRQPARLRRPPARRRPRPARRRWSSSTRAPCRPSGSTGRRSRHGRGAARHVPFLPWGLFLERWPEVSPALRDQSAGGGLSVWVTPLLAAGRRRGRAPPRAGAPGVVVDPRVLAVHAVVLLVGRAAGR